MKAIFKCDYCNFMDTQEEVEKHEPICQNNYDRKSCFTCAHKTLKSIKQFGCDCGQDIPEGKIFEFCPDYQQAERPYTLKNIFGDLFGGI